MLVRLLQLLNVQLPMLVMLFGIVILVRLSQRENTLSLMLVRLFGIVTLVRPLHASNAP